MTIKRIWTTLKDWSRTEPLLPPDDVASSGDSIQVVESPRPKPCETSVMQAEMARVEVYRRGGSTEDGIHVLFDPVKITRRDYELMAADNSCARIKSGGLSGDVTLQGLWFAVARDSGLDPNAFWNSHGSSDDGGKTWYLEALHTHIPKPEWRVSPAEVVWHRRRVDALKAAGVEQEERTRIMMEERSARPWERVQP